MQHQLIFGKNIGAVLCCPNPVLVTALYYINLLIINTLHNEQRNISRTDER